jgi:ribosome-associated protein
MKKLYMNTEPSHEPLLDENGDPIKSKTQLKQEAEDLKKIGGILVDLTPGQLNEIPLDDELTDAIALAQRINKKKDGFRRQLQLIGKLLRNRDIAEIESAINKLRAHHLKSNTHFHLLEELRDKIVDMGDSAIQELLNEHPQLDRQKLRQMQRQAVKQRETEKPPKAAREIFQYLKQNIEE